MFCLNYFKCCLRHSINPIAIEMFTPVIFQPIIVLIITLVMPENILLITIGTSAILVFIIYLAKHDLRSHLLYYWIVSSITYIIIVFELIVVSLSEIDPLENFFLILFSILSIFFLYLTKAANKKSFSNGDILENGKEALPLNGNDFSSICPACRIKMNARNYHCHICQECISKYDHHSYWLNCCIGEYNLHLYVAGIFFGVFALAYGSLLILTTICSPEFKFGILLPEDCTDVGDNIEMCTCLVSGIYCMELAFLLFLKVGQHFWFISRGLSTFEWKEHFKYNLCYISPYSYGFKKNWIYFFKSFKNFTFSKII